MGFPNRQPQRRQKILEWLLRAGLEDFGGNEELLLMDIMVFQKQTVVMAAERYVHRKNYWNLLQMDGLSV